jgi:3-deoxy-manno-octulosonate cytidylyltransferase (CMP-KDO synthetase)
MASKRLPGKALSVIAGYPMIIHVARRAAAAKIGPIIIATDHIDIKNIVENYGFQAIMTDSNYRSGSDRVYAALKKVDPTKEFDTILNIQGDLPNISIKDIYNVSKPLLDGPADIATLCTPILQNEAKNNTNIVKVIGTPLKKNRLRTLYFTRAQAPYGNILYKHIGIYAYRRNALELFSSLHPSPLEKQENLEQLRAIENCMRIDATIVNQNPISVDTILDLERARIILTQ